MLNPNRTLPLTSDATDTDGRDQVHARELYDHRNESSYPTDFNVGENENVANRSENAAVITMLSQMIKQQFA